MFRMSHSLKLGAIVTGCVLSHAALSSINQDMLDQAANSMSVHYQVIDNLDHSQCEQQKAEGNCYLAELTLRFPVDMPVQGWEMYFSQITPIQWEGSEHFDIQHLNGDLHRLTPVATISKNTDYVIPLRAAYSSVSKSDVMPNYFLTSQGLATRIIKSTIEITDPASGLTHLPHSGEFLHLRQTQRNKGDHIPYATPERDFEHYSNVNQSAEVDSSARLIPKAMHTELAEGEIILDNGVSFMAQDASRFRTAIDWIAGRGIQTSDNGKPVIIAVDKASALNKEGYELTIGQDNINVKASSDTGVFYALMSLAQLFEPTANSLPAAKIIDQPEFAFRGLHIDVSRNFHQLDFIKKVLRQMGNLKLNKLHLHLADDEGWRIEIPDLPELTEVGAYRCFDLSEQQCLLPQLGSGPFRDSGVNGFYSKQEYIDIVKFAAQHHIEVIPSLDMPGHSRAAVKSMLARHNKLKAQGKLKAAQEYLLTDPMNESQYSSVQHYNDNTINPCIDSTYHFIAKVLSDIAEYHQLAGAPLKRYHIGADETAGAWVNSPACQALIKHNTLGLQHIDDLGGYFIQRIATMLSEKGIVAGAWSDGAKSLLGKNNVPKMQVNLWGTLFWQGHVEAHEFINAGWESILSIPDTLYFDFPYSANADEPGYYWASRATDGFRVFQFMPHNLPAHASFWPDRMGVPYQTVDSIPLAPQRKADGIQAQLWSETVRTTERAEYMLFPRLAAFAERAWHKADWQWDYRPGQGYSMPENVALPDTLKQDWKGFSTALTREFLPVLSQENVHFRIPPPGAKIVNGMLHANSLYPELEIYFREADKPWRLFRSPERIHGQVELKTKLAGLALSSRIIRVE